MEGALEPAAYIYEGIWTNWTKGRIQGLTWTLCPTKATLVTNSLALFVTLAGGQLWTIIRFTLHQLRASHQPRDHSQYHVEQQVILRNASTDLHTMRLMTQLAWVSRRSAGRSFLYPLSIASLGILHYILFVLAGTFSNNLVNAGSGGTFSNKLENASSAVLSRSPHCGVWNPAYLETVEGDTINLTSIENVKLWQDFLAKIDHDVQLSLEYAQQCYESNPRYFMSSRCNSLPKSNLEFEQKPLNESCPFGPQMCHDEQNAIVFNTEAIDSHHDLGINAAHADRLTYRRRTTCAVLNDTDYVIESDESTSQAIAYAYYGNSLGQDTNFTYSFSNFSSLYTKFTPQTTNPYEVNAQIAYGISPKSEGLNTFVPLPKLEQDKADLILFFLSFNGRYFEPIDDPWFSAHQEHLVSTKAPIARKQYGRDRLISTLGCTEQHQFCNPGGNCTPFLGWGQVQNTESFNAALTPKQKVVFDRMIRAVYISSLAQVIVSLAITGSPLLAIDEAAIQTHVLSLKLPGDQWKLELKYWHSIAMAQLQRTIVQWATGQIASDPQSQLVPPQTEWDSWFCENLMIPSTVYQSFSVLYLVLIITAGTMVILISWTIEDITSWVQRRLNKGSTSKKIWDEDHMLRLRRLMYRSSWKPRPPPKDYSSSELLVRPSVNVELASPLPVSIVHKGSGKYDHVSRYSRFQGPRPEAGAFEDLYSQPHPAGSTPRIWSQLPPEPPRDSWVQKSLKVNNHVEGNLPRDIPGHYMRVRGAASPAMGAVHALELFDLRANALARKKDPWI